MPPPAALPLAHPVTGHPHVDLPVALLVVGLGWAVLLVALATPRGRRHAGAVTGYASWADRLSRPRLATRAVALALLLLAVAAGRLGADDQLENLAPALAVGAGLPLLVLGSAVVPLWRWVDPWDTAARVLGPGDDSPPSGRVWPAVPLAAGWLWFLGVHPTPLDPRALGLALGGYSTLTVAGCLVRGRRRWLSGAEPLGVVLPWLTAAVRGRLAGAALPGGAGALLGVLAGGLLFGAVRRTEVWSGVAGQPQATAWASLGLVASCAAGAGVVALAGYAGRRLGDRGAVLAGAVPAVASVALALALDRNRFTTSLQLLPGLLGDPFGAGWDLLGPSTAGLDPKPLGAVGLVVAQLVVVAIGHLAGAWLVGRAAGQRARVPAALLLALLGGSTVVVLGLH